MGFDLVFVRCVNAFVAAAQVILRWEGPTPVVSIGHVFGRTRATCSIFEDFEDFDAVFALCATGRRAICPVRERSLACFINIQLLLSLA